MKLFQASALLAALALTVTVSPAQAMPWPCWQVKMVANGKSEAQIWQYARANKIRVTRRLEREVRACIEGK